MPRIFDNIHLQLLPILRDTLKVSYWADSCVSYFNFRGWRKLDDLIEQYVGGEVSCLKIAYHLSHEAIAAYFRPRFQHLTKSRLQRGYCW
jgi:hypothetical protein